MSFKTFLLLVIILFSGIFVYLKMQSLGDENSSFNQTTRYRLGKFGFFRTTLGLHKDGDSRAEYLLKDSSIIIEFVQPSGAKLSEAVMEEFARKVSEYTGRNARVVNTDTVAAGFINEGQLAGIVRGNRRHFDGGSSNLFVMYVDDFPGSDKNVARTYQDFGMVISHDRLVHLVREYPSSLADYQLSTLLHEFGHQIGMVHNTTNGCIMNEVVESPAGGVFYGASTPTSFCNEEIDQISAIRRSIQ